MAKNQEKVIQHPTATNKDGTPDMRIKENRDDPEKVAEYNEQQNENAVPGEGLNKDGKPDMRLKENRDNPEIVQDHQKS